MHPNLKRSSIQKGGSPKRRSDWVTKEFNENLKPPRGKERNPPEECSEEGGYEEPRHALPKGRIKKEKWSSLKHKGATASRSTEVIQNGDTHRGQRMQNIVRRHDVVKPTKNAV
ncbi:hypothetical protein NPIL_410541 [Nephila pilipes]|uniref:Uncharacterized protein n=1 Tax=Nephila pilipes TaxID=299642 RepID=A0A8X6PP53_NEPPI|nr:hypothetical protein NPIL_410541 [Nephila pilipes]